MSEHLLKEFETRSQALRFMKEELRKDPRDIRIMEILLQKPNNGHWYVQIMWR